MTRAYSKRPVEDRFWEKVDRHAASGCWEWTAYIGKDGYGRLLIHRDGGYTKALVHRFAWELLVGPIPDGLDIDHLCRNRRCVKPSHLEPVTRRENLLRGVGVVATRAKQTHCKHGHTLADAYINKRGNRDCRTCRLEGERRKYHARKRAS